MNDRISSEEMLLFAITFGIFTVIFILFELTGGMSGYFIKIKDVITTISTSSFLISLILYFILKHDENKTKQNKFKGE